VARRIRLGRESAPAGTRLHAVAEQATPTKTIAEALGKMLALPVKSSDAASAEDHFGVVGHFFAQSLVGGSVASFAMKCY
jgi:hypothetical protein